MKRIYIVRHAKSSWIDFTQLDIDRPLNNRGTRDAPIMASKCVEKKYIPELLITSSAQRAKETCAVFRETFSNSSIGYQEEAGLYHAPEDKYFEECTLLDDSISSVMLFGHNPGITYLANSVSDKYIDNIPTCGVLVLDTTATIWDDVAPSNCKLVDFLYPKMFV